MSECQGERFPEAVPTTAALRGSGRTEQPAVCVLWGTGSLPQPSGAPFRQDFLTGIHSIRTVAAKKKPKAFPKVHAPNS